MFKAEGLCRESPFVGLEPKTTNCFFQRLLSLADAKSHMLKAASLAQPGFSRLKACHSISLGHRPRFKAQALYSRLKAWHSLSMHKLHRLACGWQAFSPLSD